MLDNLPQFLSFAAFRLPAGMHVATVEFLDAGGQTVSNLTKTINLNVMGPTPSKVVFISDTSIPTLNL